MNGGLSSYLDYVEEYVDQIKNSVTTWLNVILWS